MTFEYLSLCSTHLESNILSMVVTAAKVINIPMKSRLVGQSSRWSTRMEIMINVMKYWMHAYACAQPLTLGLYTTTRLGGSCNKEFNSTVS